jgi:GNAT superfamily N-acetyltransferase
MSDALQAADLNGERNGPGAGDDCRRVIADDRYGPHVFTVVVDGDRVVSALCLLDERFLLDGVELAVGRPEYVATHPDYTGRGFIRAQLDEVHRWSRERGDVLQIITGIPYFYRQFGYEFAIENAARIRMPAADALPAVPAGFEIRDTTASDAPAIVALDEAHAAGDLRGARDARAWESRLGAKGPERNVLVLRDRTLEGFGAVWVDESSVFLSRAAAATPGAATALIAHAASFGSPFAVEHRPGGALSRVASAFGEFTPPQYGVHVRVPDVAALLDRLRPVLTQRLQASAFAGESGSLLISFYRHSVTLRFARGEVTAVEIGPGEQNPTRHGGIGIPPDLAATLIFGRFGASELASLHFDVALGPKDPLAEVLFPKLTTDLLLFY